MTENTYNPYEIMMDMYDKEEKLKALIIEMKTELAELKRQKAEGTLPPQAPEGKKGPKKTKENK